MPKELTWRMAIDKVLASSGKPLHYNEITEILISEGLRKNLGATPAATVNAQISGSIKHEGDKSPYVRVGKGVYALSSVMAEVISETNGGTESGTELYESEDQYNLVSSFGMFWKRELVDWSSKPKILGMQQIGAIPVNFNKQYGIYLLYDGREVIYVGRTTDRPLGKRLYEHTIDRMSARWDRFSWFGLLPVSDKGELGDLPESYDSQKMIPSLEAILIEALEPRQNRKRGDDLASVEYIQKEDPEIAKRKAKTIMENALSKL